jgi:hypothetical protein
VNRTIFAGLAATALLLSGCGGDDDSDEGADTTTTEAEATTTEAESTTTEAEEGGGLAGGDGGTTTTETEEEGAGEDGASTAGEATPDGTTLAVGEPATVAYDATNGMIDLELVVDEVVASSWADLEAAGLTLDATDTAGVVPYFIRYSATLQSDVDVAGTGINNELDGVTTDGDIGGTLITVGLDECRNESFRSDAAPGDVLEGCKVALLPEGSTLAGAVWEGELTEGITWQV